MRFCMLLVVPSLEKDAGVGSIDGTLKLLLLYFYCLVLQQRTIIVKGGECDA